jgi:general secretion pathway protein K
MSLRSSQRGVAMITALILVALATVVAVAIAFDSSMTARRAVATFSMEQGLQLGQGAEALAAYALREDRNGEDTPADSWNQHYGPVEIVPEVSLEAQLYDEQGKFNLNTLLLKDGTPDPEAVAVFKRLLELSDVETRWAGFLLDWLDENVLPEADGGEDSLYSSQMPPYRTANRTLTSVSELLQLPGLDRARYQRLLPHLTALPPEADHINVCAADPIVLDALNALSTSNRNNVEYSRMTAEEFASNRSKGCYPPRATLAANEPAIDKRIADRSSYFQLHSWVRIGTARFALYSLMYRDGNGQARPIARSFGTE